MKVALCLYGKVGNKEGKSDEARASVDILEYGHRQYYKNIIEPARADVFLHSWSTELESEIIDLYKPKAHLIEEQIVFTIPSHVRGAEDRKQGHYSRWYSTFAATQQIHGDYDLVILSRFDLNWKIPFSDIAALNVKDDFYVQQWCGFGYNNIDLYKGGRGNNEIEGLPHFHKSLQAHGLLDWWFISSKEKVVKFGGLYQKLDEYTKKCPNDSSGRISNHRLAHYHLNKLGYDFTQVYHLTDTPLIRREVFGTKK